MSTSPWSAYGRIPQSAAQAPAAADKQDPVANVMNEAKRDRELLEKYLDRVLKEYNEIRSGSTGYRQIIADALAPSNRPETIEERFARLAAKAQTRRSSRPPNSPSGA
ncbi:MAG TPA: hypothetical protein VM164_00040 [Burkholderiales bacterium]|nr:hypothetical protein [Burkholderiales bacterium]